MADYPQMNTRKVTLNSLKEQLYSLNMCMLLALQNHDAASQTEIQIALEKVQKDIDHMCLN